MLTNKSRMTELLAPARNYEAACTAVDWGADALYMGGPKFGARHDAGNTVEDIARTVNYARPYGVRVYATLNTLLFENELLQARRIAEDVVSAGVDALIIQDMAYMEMELGGVEFHASTQTFNASPEKVKFLEKTGFSRVILERGLCFEQIEAIRRATSVDLECFVHGAICVGQSGRCWLSRTMSPRSGNRGECSQPCRLTYDLIGEEGRIVMKNKHLLSVMDLDLSERIGSLLDAGITSFKIEGRLKDTAYVKNTVSFYRRKIDSEMAMRKDFVRASSGESVHNFIPDLDKTFTRGRSEYFFDGPARGVASPDTPKSIGHRLGMVIRSAKGWFEIDGDIEAKAGDGICFIAGDHLEGTNINRVEGRRIFPNSKQHLEPGTTVYRNYDHTFAQSIERCRSRRVIDVRAVVSFSTGSVRLSLEDADGVEATAMLNGEFEPAKDSDAMAVIVKTQITRSGDTIFRITDVEITGGAAPFIPVSAVNSLRRDALERLLIARRNRLPIRNIAKLDEHYPYNEASTCSTNDNEAVSCMAAGEENITNSLSERFYRKHGVEQIEPGLDLLDNLTGRRVMRTPYCIRRETGMCLKEDDRLSGEMHGTASHRESSAFGGALKLVRGNRSYRLEFDCSQCMMNVIYEK